MDQATWLNLALLCLAGAASPGMSWFVIVSMSIARGPWIGIAGALGHGLGITCFAMATVFGLSVLLLAAPMLSEGLTWLGLGLLAYVGVVMVRSGAPPLPESLTTQGGFWAGFLVAIVNPKVLIFFLAIFGPFVNPAQSFGEHLGMGLLAGGIDALVYTGVAVFAGIARRLLEPTRLIQMHRGLGALLLASAVFLAARALPF